jgi:hypothetical protein
MKKVCREEVAVRAADDEGREPTHVIYLVP